MTKPSARTARGVGGSGKVPPVPASSGAVELRLAATALRVVAVLALPVLGVSWAAAGREGIISAGVGLALVGGSLLLSAALLALAARFGPGALLGAALGGYVLRLMIYAVLLVILRPVEIIHGPSLAITVVVVMIVTLAFEAWYVTRTPGFYWLDPVAGRPAAAPEEPERTIV